MANRVAEVILRQVPIVKSEYDKICQEVEDNEYLISDMIDYLCDNQELEIDKHFKPIDFVPKLVVDLPYITLPPPTVNHEWALHLEGYCIRIEQGVAYIVLTLRNDSKRLLRNITGSLFATDNSLKSCKSSVLGFNDSETTQQNEAFDARPLYVPYFISLVRPVQRAYVVMTLEAPTESEVFTVMLQYYEDYRDNNSDVRLTDCFLHSVNKWRQNHGCLKQQLRIDPWTPFFVHRSGLNDDDHEMHLLKMKICSNVAFLPAWTVEVEADENFLSPRSPLLNLEHFLQPNLTIFTCPLLPPNFIFYHGFESIARRLLFTIYAAESTADTFFRKLLHSKLCSRISEAELDECQQAKSVNHDFLLNNLNDFVGRMNIGDDDKVDGCTYRRLHCELLFADIVQTSNDNI